jgi:hypothetical protein
VCGSPGQAEHACFAPNLLTYQTLPALSCGCVEGDHPTSAPFAPRRSFFPLPLFFLQSLTSYLTPNLHENLTISSLYPSCLPQQALPLQRRPTTCACPHTVHRTLVDIIHIPVPASPHVKSSWSVLSSRLTLTMEHSRPLSFVIQSASESGPSEENRAAEKAITVSNLSAAL